MSYHLNIDWQGQDLNLTEGIEVQLFPFEDKQAGQSMATQQENQRFRFENLESGNYLLSFRYTLSNIRFDSFYFHLQSPDITLIKLDLHKSGCQISQMGFLNDYGEFVDMLVYEGQKPYLTFELNTNQDFQVLSEYLSFKHSQTPPQEAQKKLNQMLGDLKHIYPTLTRLWSYQLKFLIQPALLLHTTAAWKACLMHLLRNDLVLMDNEKLHKNLSESIEFTQQESTINELLNFMNWDADKEDWENEPAFLNALAEQHMLTH